MSKYGAIIAEARKPENEQKAQKNQTNGKPANQKARKPESKNIQKAKTVSAGVKEADVNLSIKVALRRRRHWMGQAKLKGETLTEAITDALSKRYGEPKD